MTAPGATRRNTLTALVLGAVGVGMVGAAFAAVPLYQWFCKTTGYGGTTQVAVATPGRVSDRAFEITFDANVQGTLPWRFQPEQTRLTVQAGAVATAHYVIENLTDRRMSASAAFNVSPELTGAYFTKIACFCFQAQTLAPHERVVVPVTFFVDPGIDGERDLASVKAITLSYTLFELPADSAGPRT